MGEGEEDEKRGGGEGRRTGGGEEGKWKRGGEEGKEDGGLEGGRRRGRWGIRSRSTPTYCKGHEVNTSAGSMDIAASQPTTRGTRRSNTYSALKSKHLRGARRTPFTGTNATPAFDVTPAPSKPNAPIRHQRHKFDQNVTPVRPQRNTCPTLRQHGVDPTRTSICPTQDTAMT